MVCEIYPDETSEFWRAPGITADDQKKINTTVYRLPGAGFAEKDGTFVNSARWLQWKNVAVPPPGQCRLDQEILATIFLKVRELYQERRRQVPRSRSERVVRLHHPVQSIACPRSRKNSTAKRSPTSPTRRQIQPSKPASNSQALPGSKTTAQRPAATGSTADHGPKPAP